MSSCNNLLPFQVPDVRKVLILLERIHGDHLEICGLICIRMLGCTKESFLQFEISQFASFVYTKLRVEGVELSEDHQTQLKEFLENLEAGTKYVMLGIVRNP